MKMGTNGHWVIIKVHTKQGGNLLQLHRWEDLRFELRTKYDWYFRYRAALAQVQHPRAYVDFRWGLSPASPKTEVQILKNRIRAKRAKITGYKNKLQRIAAEWDSIFPIEEDMPYQRTVCKINELERELQKMEETFTDKNNNP